MKNGDSVIVVSGIPRSGTSMVMKMLSAGGVEIVTDNLRKPDIDNPEGYYEFEKVKRLKDDCSWLSDSKGKAVKIISHLLYYLPNSFDYKILFVRRKMEEILASQRKMFERLQKAPDKIDDLVLSRKFNVHLANIQRWIKGKNNMECLNLNYGETIRDPIGQAKKIVGFLGRSLSVDAMTGVINPDLYRNRMQPK